MEQYRVNENTLRLYYPASFWRNIWREALVSGDGTLGASFLGGSKYQTVMINHADLWSGGSSMSLPDVSQSLGHMRARMDQGEFREASWELVNNLKDRGYEARMEAPFPMGDLKAVIAPRGSFRQYQRLLFMDKGVVASEWLDGGSARRTEGFVSRKEHMLLYRICADKPDLDVTFWLDMHENTGEKPSDIRDYIKAHKKSWSEHRDLIYVGKNTDQLSYGMLARVYTDGECTEEQKNQIHVTNTDSIVIGLKIFVKGEEEDEIQRLHKEMDDFDGDYDRALADHTALHSPLYFSAELSFADNSNRANEDLLQEAFTEEAAPELVEKLWKYGRYLFISGTRKDGNPFPLYGLWAGSYRLPWTHNMANENIQMIYWHCFTGNLAELHEAVFGYYNKRLEIFRDNARKLYGCHGIWIPAGTTPDVAVPCQIVPVIINWTGAAGWLAQHYIKYAAYKRDKKYIEEEILPYLFEVAEFYQDFITYNPDGTIKLYPSVSPENTPNNFMPPKGVQMAHPMPTAINATMDLAIVKEFFSNLEKLTSICGCHEDKRPLWRKVIDSIPPYQINDEGAIKEWQAEGFEDNYNHRHLSHIYPVFPGTEINSVDNREELEGYKKAVALRKIDAQTGWSMAHMAAIYARFEEGERAMESLDNMAKACLLSNFFTLHNDFRGMGITLDMDPAPVQLDAIMGYVNGVQEMLFYAEKDLIKLLPALPKKLSHGEARRFRYACGSVDMSWDIEKASFHAKIRAIFDHKVRIKLPEIFENYRVYAERAEYTEENRMLTVYFSGSGTLTIDMLSSSIDSIEKGRKTYESNNSFYKDGQSCPTGVCDMGSTMEERKCEG